MLSFVYQMKRKQLSRYFTFVSLDETVYPEDEMQFAELIGDPSWQYQPSSILKIKETEEEYQLCKKGSFPQRIDDYPLYS